MKAILSSKKKVAFSSLRKRIFYDFAAAAGEMKVSERNIRLVLWLSSPFSFLISKIFSIKISFSIIIFCDVLFLLIRILILFSGKKGILPVADSVGRKQ